MDVISPTLIFHLIELTEFIGQVLSIAQFCNLGIGVIFGTWDLGEIENFNLSGMWRPPLKEYTPHGGKIDYVGRRSKYLAKVPTRKGEAPIINRGLKAAII